MFSKIYAELKKERVSYDKKTHPVQNKMLKLSLNGTYGKTNSKFSVFFDPKYTMQTTLNGQLMLAMLWDRLSFIPHCQIIQANTDGVTIKCLRKDKDKVRKVCKHWEKFTRMELEEVEYSRMWIRDGNNYIAEYTNGSLKSKGDYLYGSLYHTKGMEPDGVEWHKNHSAIVVQKAVEANLAKGIPIDEFIKNHDDAYDFFLITNIKGKSKLMWGEGADGDNEEYQKNTRYIVSNTGKYMSKVMPPLKGKSNPRWFAINKGWLTTPYNKIESIDVEDYDINFDFYIEEAEKLAGVFK